jgi:hypothetical protein
MRDTEISGDEALDEARIVNAANKC